MVSNEVIIGKIAKEFLHQNNISYLTLSAPEFHPQNAKNSTHDFAHWVVPYVYKAFQEEDAFIYLDDATQKIMYILTKHGNEYIDGKSKTVQIEDDDEDWDDL